MFKIVRNSVIIQRVNTWLLFGVSVITHTIRHTVGLLWTSDQPVTDALALLYVPNFWG
jgi:hypothetical protein